MVIPIKGGRSTNAIAGRKFVSKVSSAFNRAIRRAAGGTVRVPAGRVNEPPCRAHSDAAVICFSCTRHQDNQKT